MKGLLKIIALPPLLLLTACGASEPSEKEMRLAVEKQFGDANALVRQLVGTTNPNLTTRVLDFDKLKCKAQQNSTGYVCSFSMKVKSPMGEQETTLETVFIKGKDGWTAQ